MEKLVETAVAPSIARYHYRLKSTGKSGGWYGPCEVCCKQVSDVFIQCEMREFDNDGALALTFHEARGYVFGHEECLRRQQRRTQCSCLPGTGCPAWHGRRDDVIGPEGK